MEIAHRINTIEKFYKHYYEYNCRNFEIDVQLCNDKIILYHDEISIVDSERLELLNNKDTILLYDFLRFIPDDITINIEIKDYSNSNKYFKKDDLEYICVCKICNQGNPKKSCRSHKNNYIIILLDELKDFKNKRFIISSFDKYICNNVSIVEKLNTISSDIIYIVGELENYDKNYKKICIHRKFLDILNYNNHDLIYVYDVKIDEIEKLKADYKYITGWIIDY